MLSVIYIQPNAKPLSAPSVHTNPPIPKWIDDIVYETFYTSTPDLPEERNIDIYNKKSSAPDSSWTRKSGRNIQADSNALKDTATVEFSKTVKNQGSRDLQSDSFLPYIGTSGLDSLASAAAIVDNIVLGGGTE